MAAEPPYAGEALCQFHRGDGDPCRNKAYHLMAEAEGRRHFLSCGVHRRGKQARGMDSADLPKRDPAAREQQVRAKLAADRAAVEAAAEANAAAGQRGDLIVSKLRMMRPPEDVAGYMKVFPNNRHGGRRDGYGCPALSPMRLGPVHHGQPGLPPAKSIENAHQGAKRFPGEVDEKGDPTPEALAEQIRMYESDVPQRHKAAAKAGKAGKGCNRNAPLYSLWRRADGTEVRFSYVESRQFYCTFYERLATVAGSEAAEDLAALRACLAAGYNLQIVGYDGRPVPRAAGQSLAATVEAMYLDPSAPFGHELVVYSLLALDPADYPWRKHKTEDF